MQLTFSDKLKSYNPDTLFGMRVDDIYVNYDMNADYGVDPASSILSQTDSDTLVPRFVAINKRNISADDVITYNQITQSEYYSEKDSSIYVGRNKSEYNGLLYYLQREEPIFNGQAEVDTNDIYTQYFQLYFGANDLKTRYKYIDYDNNDDYAVVLLDKGDYSRSYVLKQNMYTENGNVECWEDFLNPVLVPPETILQPDFRNIAIALINPRTGEIYDSYPFFFARNGSLTLGTNCNLYEEKGTAYDVYEQGSRNSTKKPKIRNIITKLPDGRTIALKREDDDSGEITIPQIQSLLKVEVDVGGIPNRDSITIEGTDQSPQTIMRFMQYDIRFYYSGRLELYNRVKKAVDITHQVSSTEKSILFCCRLKYFHNTDHRPQNGFYSINYSYEFIIDNVEYEGKLTTWKGNLYNFRDRGIGAEINAIPTFDNMPVMAGFMPSQSKANMALEKYNFLIDGNHYELEHIKHMHYGTTNSNAYFDNYARFKDRDDRPYKSYYDLYFSTYRHNDSVIDKDLLNYWACDKIGNDLKSLPNAFKYGDYGWYRLQSDMRLDGNGKVTHEKEYHRILKDSIKFDNITGNAMLSNTWDNNGQYTVNFWFKSTQKTKGCILSDIDRFHPTTKGIYLGVSDGGFLEISVNAQDTKIYPNVNITDGNWHMITLIRSRHVIQVNSNMIVRVDNNTIDAYVETNQNKDFGKENAVYFMGHPLGKNVVGNLSRVAFYGVSLATNILDMIYAGDVETHIAGTIILQNVPHATEIRVYNDRTGELVSRVNSDKETGKFLYRNYENYSVYLLVMDFAKKFGDMQAIGPVEPRSLI